jgi:hypothetical protein
VESADPEPSRLLERVETAGRRLTAASITWGARPTARPALALTDRDIDILAAVDEHRYLTTSMLALLFWGSDSYAARRRLKKLHDAGLLEKFRPAVATGGSHEWIYRLAEPGWDALAAEREPSGGRAPRELHYLGYAQHDLEVSSLVVTLALRAAPGDGPLAGRLPFEWHGPDRGRVDPARERPHASPSPGATPPAHWRVHAASSRRGVIEPDATLIGRHPDGGRFAVMIEYDRTRRAHRQATRLTRYDRFLLDGWRLSRYAELAHEPIVVFVCATDAQLGSFVEEANRRLTAWLGPPEADPQTGVYPAREQIAFTSYRRVMAGDWRMLQAPARPRDRFEPEEIEVPLDRLLGTASALSEDAKTRPTLASDRVGSSRAPGPT